MNHINDKSIDESAGQIIPEKNSDSSFNKSEAIRNAKFLIDLNLDHFERDYTEGATPNAVILSGLIVEFSSYCIQLSKINNDKDNLTRALRFLKLSQDILKQTVGKNLQLFEAAYRCGAMVTGLKVFGSSINQAKISVAEWSGTSETHIENSFSKFYQRDFWCKSPVVLFGTDENLKNSFVATHYLSLGHSIAMNQKLFPVDNSKKSSVKTKAAYDDLKESVLTYYRQENSVSCLPTGYTFSSLNFDEIRRLLLTQN